MSLLTLCVKPISSETYTFETSTSRILGIFYVTKVILFNWDMAMRIRKKNF